MLAKLNPIRNRRLRRQQGRSGATAIEFAMVAPAFLIVITVCAEFARMSILRNLSQNACYETCRFIMSEGATVADGQQRAQSILNRVGTIDADILINGADGSRDNDGNVIDEIQFDTSNVSCEIDIRLADNTVILPGYMFGDKTISSRMTMRTERYEGFFDASDADSD
jgi:Flp pilus assembly protein TadG